MVIISKYWGVYSDTWGNYYFGIDDDEYNMRLNSLGVRLIRKFVTWNLYIVNNMARDNVLQFNLTNFKFERFFYYLECPRSFKKGFY